MTRRKGPWREVEHIDEVVGARGGYAFHGNALTHNLRAASARTAEQAWRIGLEELATDLQDRMVAWSLLHVTQDAAEEDLVAIDAFIEKELSQ